MLLRPFLNDAGSCASYLFGCTTHNKLAIVDPHADLVDDYLAAAAAIGSPITAVVPRSSSTTSPSKTARRSSWGTPS
jgi:glyoxylase-like metal-dependent hydrolase (beta-lactamase superfamily II)